MLPSLSILSRSLTSLLILIKVILSYFTQVLGVSKWRKAYENWMHAKENIERRDGVSLRRKTKRTTVTRRAFAVIYERANERVFYRRPISRSKTINEPRVKRAGTGQRKISNLDTAARPDRRKTFPRVDRSVSWLRQRIFTGGSSCASGSTHVSRVYGWKRKAANRTKVDRRRKVLRREDERGPRCSSSL